MEFISVSSDTVMLSGSFKVTKWQNAEIPFYKPQHTALLLLGFKAVLYNKQFAIHALWFNKFYSQSYTII